jgi:hypothetical protein
MSPENSIVPYIGPRVCVSGTTIATGSPSFVNHELRVLVEKVEDSSLQIRGRDRFRHGRNRDFTN